MSTMNSDINFSDVGADVRRAFLGGRAVKRPFPAGYQLYKFTQYPLLGSDGRVSPWWSSVEPLGGNDPGLAETLKRAERLGVHAAEFARARSAVVKQWNSMTGLLIAQLTAPVFGFVGTVAHQPIDESPVFRNVVFIGGAKQIWLPNLTAAQIHKV